VNQYEPKEKCIREQVGRNTKGWSKRQRLEPNREQEEKREGRKKGRREGGGETRIPEPTRRTGFVHCLLIEENRRNNS
jgi:hypothetical protein